MRFEKVAWVMLALLLSASAAWEQNDLVGGVSVSPRYEAADGTSKIPPP